MVRYSFLGLMLCFWSSECIAQVVNCGEEPKFEAKVEQTLKGDISGKAQLLTKMLGNAELKGVVETSRKEIYEKHQNVDKAKIDQKLMWTMCQAILNNPTLSPSEKSTKYLEIYDRIYPPQRSDTGKGSRTTSDVLKKFTMSMPLRSIEDAFGTPVWEIEIEKANLPAGRNRRLGYLKQYDASGFDLFLATDDKPPHIAYAIRLEAPSHVLIPTLALEGNRKIAKYTDDLNFKAIAEACGDTVPIETIGPLLITPICNFSLEEGRGLSYSFGFDVSRPEFEACKKGKRYAQELKCTWLQGLQPVFVFAHQSWDPSGVEATKRSNLMLAILSKAYSLRGNF